MNHIGIILVALSLSQSTVAMEFNTIVGVDHVASNSDDSTVVGSEGRLLSSDDVTELGTELFVNNSDSAVLIGSRLNASNAQKTILIGSNLVSSNTNQQVVVGNYGAQTNAPFVVAHGAENAPHNLLEIRNDGSIVNAHIAQLENQIDALSQQMLAFANTHGLTCSPLTCAQVASAYTAQCCNQPGSTPVVV